MLKVSAVPLRRSAVLTVFRGATAINDGTTAEPRRSGRCHCGLCRTSTAMATRLRCEGVLGRCLGVVELRDSYALCLSVAKMVGSNRDPLSRFEFNWIDLAVNSPLAIQSVGSESRRARDQW